MTNERAPTLRQGALVSIVGYVLMFGTAFATFGAIPKLLDPSSAAQTSQNILAHQGLFSAPAPEPAFRGA